MKYTALILGLLLLLPVPAYSGHSPEVVLLHSETVATRWTKNFALGLKHGLEGTATIRQELLGREGMDEDYFDAVFDRLAQGHSTPLAVVTDGRIGFAFARKYGPDLFPGAPVVFCSVPRPDLTLLSARDLCVGLPTVHDYKSVADLIFILRPKTQMVVAISDGTERGKARMKAFELSMKPFMDRAQLIFPGHEPGDDNGLSLDYLGTVLSSVPRRGVTLFLGFSEDATGKPISVEAMASVLKAKTISPTFALDDTFMGTGIIGGLMITAKNVGLNAAHVVKHILAGENAQEMLPRPVEPELRLDGTAMARFGIPIPEGAIVVNKPQRTIEPDYAVPVGAIGITFGLTVFCIVFYLYRRYKP